jgi:hypothetical protein
MDMERLAPRLIGRSDDERKVGSALKRGRRLLQPEKKSVRELRRRYPIQASMTGQGTMEE